MTYEYPMQLLETINGLIEKQVEPCSGEFLEGSREHAAFAGVGLCHRDPKRFGNRRCDHGCRSARQTSPEKSLGWKGLFPPRL